MGVFEKKTSLQKEYSIFAACIVLLAGLTLTLGCKDSNSSSNSSAGPHTIRAEILAPTDGAVMWFDSAGETTVEFVGHGQGGAPPYGFTWDVQGAQFKATSSHGSDDEGNGTTEGILFVGSGSSVEAISVYLTLRDTDGRTGSDKIGMQVRYLSE